MVIVCLCFQCRMCWLFICLCIDISIVVFDWENTRFVFVYLLVVLPWELLSCGPHYSPLSLFHSTTRELCCTTRHIGTFFCINTLYSSGMDRRALLLTRTSRPEKGKMLQVCLSMPKLVELLTMFYRKFFVRSNHYIWLSPFHGVHP